MKALCLQLNENSCIWETTVFEALNAFGARLFTRFFSRYATFIVDR